MNWLIQQMIFPLALRIMQTEDMRQRGFTCARRPHHGHKISGFNCSDGSAVHVKRPVLQLVTFLKVFKDNNG